ncbi:MAG: hypothetical protein ACYC8V_01210 [Caulobacteraceae bacterium]
MKPAVWAGIAILSCAAFGSAAAGTYRIDDSASLPGDSTLAMRWRTLGPSLRGSNLVDGGAMVTVVLNTARFVHRLGKIYMVLPAQSIGPVKVEWTTQGRLLPGTLISGERALVFAGPIPARMLADTLILSVHVDGRRLAAPQHLRFHFEIETP